MHKNLLIQSMKVKIFIYSVTGCANFRLITLNSWFNQLIKWKWLLISWLNAELLVAASTSCLALLLMILEAVNKPFLVFHQKNWWKTKRCKLYYGMSVSCGRQRHQERKFCKFSQHLLIYSKNSNVIFQNVKVVFKNILRI